MPIGVPELLILLVILLVIFGPKRLPQLGRQLGSGMREFKDSISGKVGDDDDEDDKALNRSTATTPAPPATAPTAGSVPADDEAASRHRAS
jgi:sec-independent protein translocase protein TatA